MAKGNNKLDTRELRAAQAMRAIWSCGVWELVPRDIEDAPDGTHDFDLTDGATTVAVEVSTIADQDTIRDGAEWSRHFPDGVLNADGLAHGWVLTVSAKGSARETSRRLGGWLADLESQGMRSARTERWQEHLFTPEANRPSWFATLKAMAGSGVVSAQVEPTLSAGQCALLIGDGFLWSPSEVEYVSAFVSGQLAGLHSSDVEKLGRATADRRVLFLWLDAQSNLDVIRRLDSNLLSGTVTNTGTLDEVWIGRHFVDGSVAIYRWRSADGWKSFSLAGIDLIDTEI
jgi:hypothetical protein